MELTPGLRLRSQVCATEVIVVRPPAAAVDLACGGAPMVSFETEPVAGRSPEPGLDGGSQLGKRYTTSDPDDPLELLVTKAGDGTLTADGTPLVFKEAKPLPASD